MLILVLDITAYLVENLIDILFLARQKVPARFRLELIGIFFPLCGRVNYGVDAECTGRLSCVSRT
jgi:hypothetical protein